MRRFAIGFVLGIALSAPVAYALYPRRAVAEQRCLRAAFAAMARCWAPCKWTVDGEGKVIAKGLPAARCCHDCNEKLLSERLADCYGGKSPYDVAGEAGRSWGRGKSP